MLRRTMLLHILNIFSSQRISFNLFFLAINVQARFASNVTRWMDKKPGFYHGHIAFIDFARYFI